MWLVWFHNRVLEAFSKDYEDTEVFFIMKMDNMYKDVVEVIYYV